MLTFFEIIFKEIGLYKRDKIFDQTVFFLNDRPLGNLNKLQLNFFLKVKI